MTNLEWIRTLSAKELSDLLYDYWLPRGQYVWTDSRKGLVKMLGETYLERDCDKCKHQGNCYCVKGLGCPFEPKVEPQTVCKMPYEDCEDCETHLKAQYGDCNKCKWYGDKQVCGRCRSKNLYAPKDEPQTDCDHKCIQTEVGCERTDCPWK